MKQREIKFRAWEKTLKVMLPVEEIYFNDGRVQLKHQQNRTHNSYIELMQFTGLIDKNGKEIYEGDIVKIPDERIEQVIWSIDCQSYAGHGDSSTNVCAGFNISGYGNFKPDEFEVLGNIYKNADLLK